MPQHAVRVYVSGYWYGSACSFQYGCPGFGNSVGALGEGALVYTLPDRLPTPDEVVGAALHAV
jgi:hypothetical protein